MQPATTSPLIAAPAGYPALRRPSLVFRPAGSPLPRHPLSVASRALLLLLAAAESKKETGSRLAPPRRALGRAALEVPWERRDNQSTRQ
jgi:hypothetical protein